MTDNTRELDDLVQEIYVELFRSLAAFDPSRSFPAWLYGITIRQDQAYRRNRWKQRRNDATERLASTERTEHDFSLMVIDKAANQQIMDDIASLSSKLKQVIILHYLNELTQEEIAEILGIPAEGDEGTGTAEQQRRSAGKITVDTLGEEDPIDQIIQQLTAGTGKALYVADGNPDRIISNQTDYAQGPWHEGIDALRDRLQPYRFSTPADARLERIYDRQPSC